MIAIAAAPRDCPVAAPRFAATDSQSFLGHPRGLAYLAFTEAWERFSFYGMSALLLLYMIQRLLTPEVAGGILGLGLFRAGLQSMTGPVSDRAFAASSSDSIPGWSISRRCSAACWATGSWASGTR